MNQSQRPDPASVACPHGMPPWINPIAPTKPVSHAPMNQSHRPIQPVSWAPTACLHNQSHRPDPTGIVLTLTLTTLTLTNLTLTTLTLTTLTLTKIEDHAWCSWSQVSTFQHYHNLPLASSLSQSLYSSPRPYPPPTHPIQFYSFVPLPTTLCPSSLLPPSPLHPGSGLLDPSSDTPCQPRLPFRFPVHCLHWSRHSFTVSPRAPTIRHPSSRPV